MDRTHESSWLYYKIYVGRVAGGLDYLVTDMLPLVRDREDIDSWFFLRYFDERGSHLRLRTRPRRGSLDLRRALEPIINNALGNLPRVPTPLYRPVIARHIRGPLARGSVIRAVESDYEPEIEKFGARGIWVAERLFQLSSEIAITALIEERADVCSRKTLVPIFMEAVRAAFVSGAGPRFWIDYSNYWLHAAGESPDQWRPRFAVKASELKDQGVAILTPDVVLPPRARDVVNTWRSGLSQAVLAFGTLHEVGRPGPRMLAYNFAHLMNNRLGIMPIEEAYFSALLQDGPPL